MLLKIQALSDADPAAIEQLLDVAFGTDRKGRTAYLLRQGVTTIPALSFAVMDDARLIATIQCWPVKLIESGQKLILVGPVAVAPDLQGKGLGHKLMHATLDAAQAIGDPPMVMIGDPEYYERFGFYAAPAAHWQLPGPFEQRRLLVRNITGMDLPKYGMIGPDIADAI